MPLDRLYILTAFVWLVLSMVFGIWIGITQTLVQSNAHAHAGILGFVVSAMFGLMHRGWPRLRTSRLAMPQFVLYQIGTLLLIIGKYQVDATGQSTVIAPGALVVVLGTLLMMWIFADKSAE